MAVHAAERWERALDDWLAPFLAAMGHQARRRWAPLYVRGLLGPGERKSIQPMAARVSPADTDQLHHFVSSPAWDSAPLETMLAQAADRLVGGPDAVLVIDDTALPKKGTHSVGVAPQYAGALGKKANCQTLVSLTLARHEVPVPVALRLFLPAEWTGQPERMRRAGVREAAQRGRAKTTIALAELDRLIAAGARFAAVVMDAGYGISARFRQGLSQRRLLWAAGIPKVQNVYSTAVELLWPVTSKGRPRKHPVPSEAPVPAEAALRDAAWRRVTWRRGTKGALRAAFAARRVRPADGVQLRTGWHAPGEAVWLVGERRVSGERKYYLCNLPADASLKTIAALIKARWVCEQAHQQMKEELGLDHFEGRSWTGLHRHALLTMIAFAFLQHLRLEQSRTARGKNPDRPTAATDAPSRPARPPRASRRPRAAAMPPMSRHDRRSSAGVKCQSSASTTLAFRSKSSARSRAWQIN
jgi:SRSO17 transposase